MDSKTKDHIKDLIKKSTMIIMEYEEGDMLLLSDLMDYTQEIENNLSDKKKTKNLITHLLAIVHELLSGKELTKFKEIFTEGLDILNRFIEEITVQKKNENQLSEHLQEELETFTEKHKIEQTEVPPPQTKKEAKKPTKPEKKIENNNKKNFKISEPLNIFLVEAEDKVVKSQDLILKLEEEPDNKELLNELFRIFHTIKGECGFLKLASLGELAHNLENLMDMIRNSEITINNEIIDILLTGLDYSKEMLSALKHGNVAVFHQIDISGFISNINNHIKEVKISIGEILEKEGKLTKQEVQEILKRQKEMAFTKKFGEIALEEHYLDEKEIEQTLNHQKSQTEHENKQAKKADPFIKVKASQINYLVDMVGELLIAVNQLEDKNIVLLNKITRQIQHAAMQLRTVKVENLFINMKRMIRDLAKNLNKTIETEILGSDLEIDRNIVEALEEPLLHIVRNAAGHGLEENEARLAANKNPAGKILIKAERQGNHIVITVRDDGKGLEKEKILNKAIEKGLIEKSKISTLTDNEIFQFIMLPGFSTAAVIDTISGRGVGMDIVKKTINSLRGQVEIYSEKGQFTEINLIFPLSTAIIDGMIILSNNIPFIIPVSNIIESLRLDEKLIHSVAKKSKVLNLREEIIPMIHLNDFFDFCGQEKNCAEETLKLAVIVESNQKKYAFIIDQIIAKKEVVIKSLGRKFEKLKGISSGTVLSGGKIGFVLNIEEIIRIISLQKK